MNKPIRGVRVQQVFLPEYRSIGFGQGVDINTGEEVRFIGDWRPLYQLAVDINHITREKGAITDLPVARVEPHQVVKVGQTLPTLDKEVRPQYELPPTKDELAIKRKIKSKEVET